MKRITAILLTLIMLVANAAAVCAEAEAPIDLSAASAALLVNTETGKTVLCMNEEKPVEAAGLVRLPALLTICRAFDEGRLTCDMTVTVSSEAAAIRGTTAFLSPNERIKAEELLKASVMLTAGDSIRALLQALYPSEAAEIEAIDLLLSGLGIAGIGENSMGKGRQFTVSELAKICTALSESGSFRKYSSVYLDSLPHEAAPTTELTNPNRLVRHYSGCFGLATGSVGSSEYAGAFIATRGTTTYLAVVTGLSDSASRFRLASDILDYGFSAYRAITLDSEAISTPAVRVTGGTANTVEAVIEGSITALMPVTETKLVTETELAETVEAPIEKGDRLGRIILKNARGETVGEIPLAAASSVSKSAFSDRFLAVIAQWLHINNGSAFQAEPHEAIVSQQIVRIYLDPPEAFHVI